jgi:hypothetical protein
MEALGHAAEQAKAGHGQIVGATAEPGVGKSRLFFEFKAKNQSGWTQCYSYISFLADRLSIQSGKSAKRSCQWRPLSPRPSRITTCGELEALSWTISLP